MSDKTYVGFATERFNDSAKQTAITKVEVYNGSVSGSAGSGDADATLRVEFPMVQTTADAASIAATILSKVSGYKYQPYEADNSAVDPAAELGDGVSICGDYGGMYVQSQTLNNACRSDISAPKEEEVDNEYPFSTSENRYIERVDASAKASIQVAKGEILQTVSDNYYGKQTSVSINANGIQIGSTGSLQLDMENISIDSQGNVTITGSITATDLTIENGATVTGLTADFITVGSLNANRISATSWGNLPIGGNGNEVSTLYAKSAVIGGSGNTDYLEMLAKIFWNSTGVQLSASGVKSSASASEVSWSTICAGGGATFG